MPTEIELKLAIDPSAIAAALRHPALRAVRGGRIRTTRLVAHYYDSPDARLARENVALRVRREGRRWIQTLKGPADEAGGAGLQVRSEWAWPVRDLAARPELAALTPWRKLVAKTVRRGLARCFTTDFERRMLPLAFADGTRAELAVDRGEIRAVRDGRLRRAPIAEIEIELKDGDTANLYRLALALLADLPLAVLSESKAERGYALRRGARLVHAEPVHAARVAFAPDATAREALAIVARECLHQIAANAPGLATERDPEWVHQMRVGTRRLRSCLSLVTHAAPEVVLDDVTTDVKWLAQCLGHARDWDVFATQTLPPFAGSFARDDALAAAIVRVRARAASRRRHARAVAREAVGSPRFHRLLLATGLVFASMGLGTGRGPQPSAEVTERAKPSATKGPDGKPSEASTAAEPAISGADAEAPGDRADTFAAALLARRHGKLLERGAALAHASAEDRHAVRIAAKRLRYAAEFFAPLFAKKRTREYLDALAELQEVLGQYNDAATAATRGAELAGKNDVLVAAAIRGWTAAQSSALAPRLARAWRDFEACAPFWS